MKKGFIWKKAGGEIEALVYKKYVTADKKISYNNYFRYQLQKGLISEFVNNETINKTEYNLKSLSKLFELYNSNSNEQFVIFQKGKQNYFKASIRPGIAYTSVNLINKPFPMFNANFPLNPGLRIGIEAEYVLPYWNNSWSMLVEPTYQRYNAESELVSNSKYEIDYKSIHFILGLRRYLNLNQKSKLYITALYITDLDLNSTIYFDGSKILEITPRLSLGLSLGYTVNKLRFEFQYQHIRNLLTNNVTWRAEHYSTIFIIGYSIN